MKHKFYYFEYSDDGINWTFGDYRKHLINILDITRDNPYRIRIKNENDELVERNRILELIGSLNHMLEIIENL